MFGSFGRFFTARRVGLAGAFCLLNAVPLWLSSAENVRINQKLKKKLNEKYHNRKDISFELTDEFRYNQDEIEKIC